MNVPGIRMVDAVEGLIAIEWIEGHTVRSLLGGGEENELDDHEDSDDAEAADIEDVLSAYGLTQGMSPNALLGRDLGAQSPCCWFSGCYEDDRGRNCKNAPRGYHPRGSYDV